ncbi:MAG: 3-dehydroquinate synthase, partial [Acholeplasmatales bacterium]|nr:3-dehydroquinate synthase [Acholeplasmatales bacterium]
MRKLTVNLKDHSYDIIIENNLLENINTYVKNVYKNKKIFIITDDKVAPLYLDKVLNSLKKDFIVDYVIIKNGEASKNLETYAYVCEKLIEKGVKRQEALIALGGGVIGDLTGFVASSLYRGIPYIGVPTSLLADMDSSIGGKTGIDFAGRKNILGAFKQPLAVLIDPNTLKTLDNREFNNGMGELIKHGAIGNKDLLLSLVNKPEIDEDIISQSLHVKKRVVELDEFDTGVRMTLNFGHTFGHGIELKYHCKHGEAVAVGMLMALKLGIDLGVTQKECYDVIYNILKAYNLPLDEYDYKE